MISPTSIALHKLALLHCQGFGSQRSKLTTKVGLIERLVLNSQRLEARSNMLKLKFRSNTQNDQVRMHDVRGKKACDFNARMTSLNDLLRQC